MKDGDAAELGEGGDDAARHPVVGMNDSPALVLGEDFADEEAFNLPLELGGGRAGVAIVGAHIIFEEGGIDEFYFVAGQVV